MDWQSLLEMMKIWPVELYVWCTVVSRCNWENEWYILHIDLVGQVIALEDTQWQPSDVTTHDHSHPSIVKYLTFDCKVQAHCSFGSSLPYVSCKYSSCSSTGRNISSSQSEDSDSESFFLWMIDINVMSIGPAMEDLLWMRLRLEHFGIDNSHGSRHLFSVRVTKSIWSMA